MTNFDYEELIIRLRTARDVSMSLSVVFPQANGDEMTRLLNDAASAIEEMQAKLLNKEG